MKVQIRFYRPFDREPDDHIYGEPFDSALDDLVGGEQNWSSAKQERDKKPRASLNQLPGTVELNEIGPLIEFVVKRADQIPNYVSAISSAVSAWTAVRALRKKELAKDDYQRTSGYKIRVGDIEVEMEREPDVDELGNLLKVMAEHKQKHPPQDSA